MAMGIFCGSATWALAASAGLATVLTHYAHAVTIMRIVGGLYLLYLAWRAFRSAASAVDPMAGSAAPEKFSRTFLRGYAIHLTNPKAIFAWLAILSLGLPPGATAMTVAVIVTGCLMTGFLRLFRLCLAVFLARCRQGLSIRASLYRRDTGDPVHGSRHQTASSALKTKKGAARRSALDEVGRQCGRISPA